jgi:hypothetical protein
MSVQFKSLAGCKSECAGNVTRLANSVAHLFNDSLMNPTPSNVLADFTAAQCSFQGYAPITITAWSTPFLGPGGGYATNAPLLTWTWVAGSGLASENVRGYYLVNAAGGLEDVVIFDSIQTISGPDQTVKYTPVEEVTP